MELLADSWVLWLVVTSVLLGGLVYHRSVHKTDTSQLTSAEDFSIRTTLFNMRKGEGDIFLGYLAATVSFSLFLAGLLRWISTVFF